jgi:hypothetical protein
MFTIFVITVTLYQSFSNIIQRVGSMKTTFMGRTTHKGLAFIGTPGN